MAAAIRTTDFPAPFGPDVYDAVGAEMDVANDPPEGLIFHWMGEVRQMGRHGRLGVARGVRSFPRGEALTCDPEGLRHGSGQWSASDDHRVRGPQLRQALAAYGPERLSGTPDELVDDGRGGSDVLDDARALSRVMGQGLHIASSPSHWRFGTVAI